MVAIRTRRCFWRNWPNTPFFPGGLLS